MTNTFIDRGNGRPADILASTRSGLYVQSLSGGSVNPVTGQFNFTCREAYLIENGRRTAPVKGATLVGNSLDVIANIDAVGDDLAFGPGICGKGQAAEVSAGQPTVRIRGMNVGGSRS
jgi:TldD protein